MQMSELSRTSGVPIPTVKFYIREGFLEPGAPEPDQGVDRRRALARANSTHPQHH
jgi:DNA-binding transcriptional MerR regulator